MPKMLSQISKNIWSWDVKVTVILAVYNLLEQEIVFEINPSNLSSSTIHPHIENDYQMNYHTLVLITVGAMEGLIESSRLPRLICTEMLVWVTSTPELWSDWVNDDNTL